MTADFAHKLRIMCANWYFTHFPDEMKKWTLNEYKENVYRLFYEVISYEHFNEMVKPDINDLSLEMFNKVQPQVFKILDVLYKEKEITKDFE